MAINLGSAYGKVGIDVSGLLSGIKLGKMGLINLAEVGQTVGTALKKIGTTLTVGLTLPIIGIGAAAIKAAGDLETSKDQINNTFGSMSAEMDQWSNDAAKNFGLSKSEALSAASGFGELFRAMNIGSSQASNMSMRLVQLSGDLGLLRGIKPDQVMNDFSQALNGNNDVLLKYGINLDGVKGIQERYQAILQQTIDTQGYFADSTDNVSKETAQMRGELKTALELLGQNLLPIILTVTKAINKLLDAFNDLTPFQKGMVTFFIALVALAGPLFGFLGTVVSIISGVVEFIGFIGGLGISIGTIGTIVGTVGTAIAGFVGAIFSILGPIILIIGAIALLYWAFKTNFMGITTTAKQLWFIIKWLFQEGWNAVVQATQNGLKFLGDLFSLGLKFILDKIREWSDFFKKKWTDLTTWLTDIWKKIKWDDIGKSIIWGIANGLLLGIPALVAAVIKAAKSVKDGFDNELDMSSPSREMEKRGLWSIQGYMRGWNQMDPNAMAQQMARPIMNQSSNQQIVMHNSFPTGLTIHQADQLIDQKMDLLLARLNLSLGGV